jgi:hypothetical protein
VIQDAEETVPSTRDVLIQCLNEDLAREYQAIIASVVYSQALKGAEFVNIAQEPPPNLRLSADFDRPRGPESSSRT